MKKTVKNWKQLSKIYNSSKFKIAPVEIIFEEDKLVGLTFETYKKSHKHSNTKEEKND